MIGLAIAGLYFYTKTKAKPATPAGAQPTGAGDNPGSTAPAVYGTSTTAFPTQIGNLGGAVTPAPMNGGIFDGVTGSQLVNPKAALKELTHLNKPISPHAGATPWQNNYGQTTGIYK